MLLTHYLSLICLLFSFILPGTLAQELLWSDEFNTGDDPNFNVWSYETGGGGWGNNELQVYSPDYVKVENGNLVITIDKDPATNTIYSSRISSQNKLQTIYARIEARIKIPNPSDGLWPCLWMLGANFDEVGWPASGSMTLLQMGSAASLQSGQGASTVGSALHWEENGGDVYDGNALETGMDLSSDFYDYAMDWTPEAITMSVNNVVIFRKEISASACPSCDEFHRPFYFIFNVAVGGNYMNIFNVDDITAPLPATMEVDYIRVYDNGFTQVSGSGATTDPPTVSPTVTATSPPTESPQTAVPMTPEPTISPSTSIPATAETTFSPTFSPTQSTTTTSTLEPTTPSPSRSPSNTNLPDSQKEEPTASPTIDADLYPLQTARATGIQMLLTDVPPLDGKSLANWAELTEIHLQNEVLNNVGNFYRVQVTVELVSQDPPYVNARERVLQDEMRQQELIFDANYAMQLPSTIQDINPFITGAFVSNYKKALYLERLKDYGGAAFQNASYVSVEAAEESTTSVANGIEDNNFTSNSNQTPIGLIVGIATAALVALILGLALYVRRRGNRRRSTGKGLPKSSSSSSRRRKWRSDKKSKWSSSNEHNIIDLMDKDMSREHSAYGTIDEESLYTSHPKHKVAPYARERGMSDNGGSSLASSSFPNNSLAPSSTYKSSDYESSSKSSGAMSSTMDADYNYRDAYKNIAKSVVSGTLGSSTNNTDSQPATVCNEFTVEAPKGKLGLILETSDEGCPTVQAIKPNSPLNGCVQVGDRLHSVDGRDVTLVMSQTVSRVIAAGQHNRRTFVFARPQENTDS